MSELRAGCGGRAFVQLEYYKCKVRNKNDNYINFFGNFYLWFTFTQMLNDFFSKLIKFGLQINLQICIVQWPRNTGKEKSSFKNA